MMSVEMPIRSSTRSAAVLFCLSPKGERQDVSPPISGQCEAWNLATDVAPLAGMSAVCVSRG
jgi:hypothetical protein